MLKRILSLILAIIMILGTGNVFAEPNNVENMHLSHEGIESLKRTEGFNKTPYWDNTHWTVGYGTKCPDDKLEEYRKNGIPVEDANILFNKHVESFEYYVNNFARKNSLKLSQNQFDMLVCFSYNVGCAWLFQTSCSLRKAILNGDTGDGIVQGLIVWNKSGGKISPSLVERRLRDANLYLNGDYSATRPTNIGYVYYAPNGGYVEHVIQGFIIKDELIPTQTPSYDGHEFMGWYTEPSGGEKITSLTKDLTGKTLYARWDSEEAVDNTLENPIEINVTGTSVNLREGYGVNYRKIGVANKGDILTITQTCEGTGYTWGKSEKGWICLKYTNFDDVMSQNANKPDKQPEDNIETSKDKNNEAPLETQTGIVKVNDLLRIRQGASTSSLIVGYLRNGETVKIFDKQNVNGMIWGKIGENKWVSLDYVQLIKDESSSEESPKEQFPTNRNESEDEYILKGEVNVDDSLRIRTDAGTDNTIVGRYYKNNAILITELKTAGTSTWGKTDKGWVCMEYVKLNIIGTVNADCLRIRNGAGLSHKIIGYFYENEEVVISEIKIIDTVKWGKTSLGWISMDYIEVK